MRKPRNLDNSECCATDEPGVAGATPPIHGERARSRVSKTKRLPATNLTLGEASLFGLRFSDWEPKVRSSNEGRPASFKFASSFLSRSAVFQKLADAQRAGARLSLMGGKGVSVWARRRMGGGGVVGRLCNRIMMSHENSNIFSMMTSRTGQGGPSVGGVPAISDDRLVIVVVVPKQKKDQKRSDGCVSRRSWRARACTSIWG